MRNGTTSHTCWQRPKAQGSLETTLLTFPRGSLRRRTMAPLHKVCGGEGWFQEDQGFTLNTMECLAGGEVGMERIIGNRRRERRAQRRS